MQHYLHSGIMFPVTQTLLGGESSSSPNQHAVPNDDHFSRFSTHSLDSISFPSKQTDPSRTSFSNLSGFGFERGYLLDSLDSSFSSGNQSSFLPKHIFSHATVSDSLSRRLDSIGFASLSSSMESKLKLDKDASSSENSLGSEDEGSPMDSQDNLIRRTNKRTHDSSQEEDEYSEEEFKNSCRTKRLPKKRAKKCYSSKEETLMDKMEEESHLHSDGDSPKLSKTEEAWHSMLEELKEFKSKHGHCNVPRKSGRLGNWVTRMRHLRRSDSLQKEKIKKLDDIGFVWQFDNHSSMVPWDLMFEQLRKYKEINGHCNVPQNEGKLGSWVHRMRKDKHSGKLREEKAHKLEELGFTWKMRTRAQSISVPWEVMFDQMKKFTIENGHNKVPYKEPYRKLVQWCNCMRHFRKIGKLSEDRVKKLDNINFSWIIGDNSPLTDDFGIVDASSSSSEEMETSGDDTEKSSYTSTSVGTKILIKRSELRNNSRALGNILEIPAKSLEDQ